MSKQLKLTYAFCTFNRAERLEKLVNALREQSCSLDFDILAVNNNSQDNTLEILQHLIALPGPSLRVVTETELGIVAARNRAIQETLTSDILVFIDDDEIPLPGTLNAVADGILREGAECVGGRIQVDFANLQRPKWLINELLGFLAEVDYGEKAFWIKDKSTPIWTANIAYDMSIFRNNESLRFDSRYDRKGKGIGGGEDVAMFNAFLERNYKIRYRPDMSILHSVEPWRLHRGYFLKLHFISGYRTAFYQIPKYKRNLFGIPLFLFIKANQQFFRCLILFIKNQPYVRQAMNFTHSIGMIVGSFYRWKVDINNNRNN